jgi:hypothetical protein
VGGSISPLAATDPDGDPLVYTVTAGSFPPGVTLNIDGTFTGPPTTAEVFTVTVQVCDDGVPVVCDTTVLTITVTVTAAPPANSPPVFTGAEPNTAQSVPVGGSIGSLAATDPDGDPLVYTVTAGSLPPGVTLNIDGTFTGSPTTAGVFTFTVQVCDDGVPVLCDTRVLTLTVVDQTVSAAVLPFTGLDLTTLLLVALLLMVSGLVLIDTSRRLIGAATLVPGHRRQHRRSNGPTRHPFG